MTRGPKGGVCRHCKRPTGALTVHERSCNRPTVEQEATLIERAGTAVMPEGTARRAQRLQGGVTDLDVARVLHAVERGTVLYLTSHGRWCAPVGSPVHGGKTSSTVHEMIRTGLLRHYRDRDGDHLVPAVVHLDAGERLSACLFAGEDLGPMRARLAKDIDLVDCQNCLSKAIV
jgi:hypothetical protein